MLDDIPAAGSRIFHIYQGTIIGPHKVLVMFRGVTHLALNDDYDFVQLPYPDGELVDAMLNTLKTPPPAPAEVRRAAAGRTILDNPPFQPYVVRMFPKQLLNRQSAGNVSSPDGAAVTEQMTKSAAWPVFGRRSRSGNTAEGDQNA